MTAANINVAPELTPGVGDDRLFFIFQSEAGAVANLSDAIDITVHRINGEDGQLNDELSGIVRADQGGFRTNRATEYRATLTAVAAVPEPASAAVLGVFCIGGLFYRKRDNKAAKA